MIKTSEIYVDQVEGILVGYPMTKVRFSSTSYLDDNGDTKDEGVITLAIPTENLLKSCRVIIAQIQEEGEFLIEMANETSNSIRDVIYAPELPPILETKQTALPSKKKK